MFQFPVLPDFPALRRRVLALSSPPEMPLAPDLEECLRGIREPRPAVLSKVRGTGESGIWRSCFSSVRRLISKAAVFSLVAAAVAALATFAGMEILDTDREVESLLVFAGIYFVLNVLAQFVTLRSDRVRLFVSLAVEAHLVGLISAKLLRLNPQARARQTSGNLKVLVTSDVRSVGMFLDNLVRNFIPAIAAVLVIAPLLIRLSGWAGAAGIAFMAAILPLATLLNQVSERFQTLAQQEQDKLASLAGEWVRNIRLIRFLSWSAKFESDVSERVRAFTRVAVGQHFMACLIFGLSLSWWMLSIGVVAIVSKKSGYQVDVVPFFGSIWLITYLAGYFTHLPNTIRLFGIARPSVKRISKLLNEEERSDSFLPFTATGPADGTIPKRARFESVGFGYVDGRPDVLGGLSVVIDLDRKTAILGEIGSGKTTLLRLLCGEFPPSSGTISFEFDDGNVYPLWAEPAYVRVRDAIAYVPQEPFVSNDSFAANVALEDLDDHSTVMSAVAHAELETDLALLGGGLAQEIGENGVNLSGGQRQRLNLARAFHSGRPLLILDDPLSAVDPRTEKRLVNALESRGTGMVLVTHRVGELMRMDRVLVMKDGRLIEDGAPAELAAREDSHFTRVLRAYEEQAESEPMAAEATAGAGDE